MAGLWPGSNQKSEMNSFMESINSTVTNVLNQQISNSSIRCEILNNQDIEFAPGSSVKIKSGSINIGQKANIASCNLESIVSNDNSNELSTKIQATIDNMMEQSTKSTSGFAATTFSNQESKSKFQAIMKNAVASSINNTSINSCAVSVSAINNQTVLIKGIIEIDTGDLNISQEAIVSSSAKCIVNNIIKNVNVSEIDSLLKSTQKSSLVTEIRGFFESVGAMFGEFKWIIIGVAIICVLGGMAFVFMKMKGNDPMMTPMMTPMTPQFSPQYQQQMYR